MTIKKSQLYVWDNIPVACVTSSNISNKVSQSEGRYVKPYLYVIMTTFLPPTYLVWKKTPVRILVIVTDFRITADYRGPRFEKLLFNTMQQKKGTGLFCALPSGYYYADHC